MPERRRPRRAAPLLVVDLGNSRTAVACFTGEALTARWSLTTQRRTVDEVMLVVGPLLAEREGPAPRAAVLCSVVPAHEGAWVAALERLTGAAPLVAGHTTVRGLRIVYREPERLGPDRIANALAVRARHGAPAIVVDLGTATNFDCLSAEGAFTGGAIAPGLGASAEALFQRAARLPRVPFERPERALAAGTEQALKVGLVWGWAAMVDGLVRRLQREMGGRPKVVATGGWARVVAPECETVDTVDDDLTLHGLRLLWEDHA
jgi:type III pantothenate kinase